MDVYIGWLGADQRWFLPLHQPVEDADFMPVGWCGGCETCLSIPTSLICGVCSYDPKSGHPDKPVAWPCPTVKETCRCRNGGEGKTPVQSVGKYLPRINRGGKLRPPEKKEEGYVDRKLWKLLNP